MSKLEIENLNKTYNPKVIPVKDISLEVDDGEFLSLLGPSGCGKSTLLRLIAGLERPTSGKVMINGFDMTRIRPGDRNIAMVFQSYALYPHMTVYQNIASGLKLRKMPSAQIRQQVEDVTRKLGLEHLSNRKPGQMSGGQRQRVALGRALVRQPDLFLLDEPLSNLDALLREQVRADLKQLFEKQQSPVVYVTHDQTEAMTLSTKVAVLYDGMVQQLDSPQRIYNQPANQFVAGFVGSPQMNLVTLNCQDNYAILGDYKIPLPKLSKVSRQVVMGIRPEAVSIVTSEDQQTIQGRIHLVQNMGMHSLISVQVKGSESITIRALVPPNLRGEGEEVTLAIPPQLMHWFDVKTGDRLCNFLGQGLPTFLPRSSFE
jgi:multiple sugar transport system ATP-binding protein